MQTHNKQNHSNEILWVYPPRTESENWWCRQYGNIEIPEGWDSAARAHIRHNYTPYEDQLVEFGLDLEPGDFLYREVKSEAQEVVDEFLSRHREES